MPLQQATEYSPPTATMPALQAQGLGHLAEAMEGSFPPKFQKMTEELCEVGKGPDVQLVSALGCNVWHFCSTSMRLYRPGASAYSVPSLLFCLLQLSPDSNLHTFRPRARRGRLCLTRLPAVSSSFHLPPR